MKTKQWKDDGKVVSLATLGWIERRARSGYTRSPSLPRERGGNKPFPTVWGHERTREQFFVESLILAQDER